MSNKEFEIQCGIENDDLPFCCGMREYGNFSAMMKKSFSKNKWNPNWDWVALDDGRLTPAQLKAKDYYHDLRVAWQAELASEVYLNKGCIFNFAKELGMKSYDASVLMELVCELPGCVEVGVFVNPNSGNTIRTLAVYPQKKGKK